jgi:D-alanyl-D-alanine carboxypeptidase
MAIPLRPPNHHDRRTMFKTWFCTLLVLFFVIPAQACAQAGPGSSPFSLEAGSLMELHAELTELERTDRFSGVVLLARGEAVHFSQVYGDQNREEGVPVELSTRFNIGSLGKSFTGVGILRLLQDGRISLDDPVGMYLPSLPEAIGAQVTIAHLLQMRSGMGDYLTDPAFQEDPGRYDHTQALLELIASRPLEFAPGTATRYSNSGFVVLGAILETLEGRSYHDIMHAWIFEPLGMSDTGPEGPEAQRNTAFGYSAGPQGTGPLRRFPAAPATAAGGTYSTVSDLHRFVLALLRDELLDPVHTDLFLNMYVPGADPSIRETTRYARAGGAPGVSAVTMGDPTTLDVVIVLSNRSFAGNPVASALWDQRAPPD